jgi:hypothetical protein
VTRQLVLVISIGRSGTSLFTGILAQLGFRVPQPEVEANRTNPRGFSEPRWVVDFHRALMRARRVRLWDSRPAAWKRTATAAQDGKAVEELKSWLAVQFVGTENVVIKDPRIAWFLPLWRRCASELDIETSFAIVARNPAEAVASARRWYGTRQSDASRSAAWLNVTRYEKLLADWPGEIARIGEALDLPVLANVERSAHPQIDAFVDPTLNRSTVSWDEVRVPAQVRTLADDAWAHMSRQSEPGGDDEEVRAALDATRAAYVDLYAETAALAYSSLAAAAPRRRRGLVRGRKGLLTRGRNALRRRAVRSLPYRQLERLRATTSVLPLAAGGLTAVSLRAVFLLPPRYRERVPIPVVRVFMRFLRWLRD